VIKTTAFTLRVTFVLTVAISTIAAHGGNFLGSTSAAIETAPSGVLNRSAEASASFTVAGSGTAKGVTRYADNLLSSNCTSGNYSIANRNCSGSDGNAYRTIEAAASGLGPGDIVNIRTSGTVYTGSAFNNGINLDILPAGTSSNHLVIQKYPNDSGTVTIRGIIGNNLASKHITFRGGLTGETKDFVINCGNSGGPIRLPGILSVRHVRFENIEVTQCSGMAIQFLADSQFINLNVHTNGFSTDPSCLGACHAVYTGTDPAFVNNVFDGGRYHHNAGWGIHCYATCANTTIRNLRVDNNGQFAGSGVIMASGSGNVIHNVVIDNNRGNGLYMNGSGMVAYNLSVVNNDVVYARDGMTIKDSIVLGGINPDSRIAGCCTITQSNNITSGNASSLFVDPAKGNFQLLPKSKIKAVGADLSSRNY
jgi:hypothetical protein